MNILKNIANCLILLCLVNLIFYNVPFAASDINNSTDTDIKTFGSWKVYLLNLKNSKKLVVMEVTFDRNHTFRITLDKSSNIAYTIVQPNIWNYPHKLEQSGNVLLIIGDNKYIVPSQMMAHNKYVITFLNGMPDNFVNLASHNKVFMVSYDINFKVAPPILLDGFNSAFEYANKLKIKADYIK